MMLIAAPKNFGEFFSRNIIINTNVEGAKNSFASEKSNQKRIVETIANSMPIKERREEKSSKIKLTLIEIEID